MGKNKEYYSTIYGVDENIRELEMTKKLKSFNIIKERVEYYKDFTLTLLYYIYETYLGKEYVKTEYDIRGHYTWCFKKILDDYEKEDIIFVDNEKLYDYFYAYYLNQFYKNNKNESLSYYEKFWENIFDLDKTKKRGVFEVLVELYEIFDITINQKIESVELV